MTLGMMAKLCGHTLLSLVFPVLEEDGRNTFAFRRKAVSINWIAAVKALNSLEDGKRGGIIIVLFSIQTLVHLGESISV